MSKTRSGAGPIRLWLRRRQFNELWLSDIAVGCGGEGGSCGLLRFCIVPYTVVLLEMLIVRCAGFGW